MRKMDEMELFISLKAIKLAWLYAVLFLFIWTVYSYMKHGSFNSPAFFLLISQNVIYMGMNHYFKWKLNANEK